MPCVRLTVVKPKAGKEAEVVRLLQELDGVHAHAAGLILSLVMRDEDLPEDKRKVGRLSLWQSRVHANGESRNDRTQAIRARLLGLSRETLVESLMDVRAGWFPIDLWPMGTRSKFPTPVASMRA